MRHTFPASGPINHYHFVSALSTAIPPDTLVATGKPPELELGYDRLDEEVTMTLGELAGRIGVDLDEEQVLRDFETYMANGREHWFTRKHGGAIEGPVAYFCAEYGLQESLPIYSGGLGVLAGDHCKVASDNSTRDFERGVCTGFIDGFAAGHHAAEQRSH